MPRVPRSALGRPRPVFPVPLAGHRRVAGDGGRFPVPDAARAGRAAQYPRYPVPVFMPTTPGTAETEP